MQKVIPVPSCLADATEARASLSAQASVSNLAMNEGYRRVRCSAAMIGLAISMSAANVLLPHQNKPAVAANPVSSELTFTDILESAPSEPTSSEDSTVAAVKLAPPALRHQVKAGESIWQLSENYQVSPELIAKSNNLTPASDLEVGQTIRIPSLKESNPTAKTETVPKNLSQDNGEQVDSAVSNLRQTRERLKESLVALRKEEKSDNSTQTQVVVSGVSDTDSLVETTTPIRSTITTLSASVPEPQAIQIPVEMPSTEVEFSSPTSTTSENKPSTPLIVATPSPKRDSEIFQDLQPQSPEPLPIPRINNATLPKPREENPDSLKASKPETDSFDNSIPIPVTPAQSLAESQPESFSIEVEPPQMATVHPSNRPLPAPQLINTTSQPTSQATYNVQRGDTLNSIARRHGISVAQLIKANNITNPNLIRVNQSLVIPGKSNNQRTVISGRPVHSQNNNSPLPEITPPSTLVSNLPSSRQSQSMSDAGAIQISVEVATDSYTEKLRSDITSIQEQYPNSQPIALEVEQPDFKQNNLSQVRNPEWDKNIRKEEQEQLIGAAPINVEEYNDRLRIPVGETVSPELPPLSDPDKYLPDAPARFDGYIWPSRGVLTSGYGWRWGRMHRGIDIAGPVGTPIVAAASGEVIFSGWNSGGFGNLVKLKHPDGSVTLYAHNHRNLVRRGQRVQQGDLIAEMGSTGRSTGPHVHFEIHPSGQGAVNPMAYLPRNR